MRKIAVVFTLALLLGATPEPSPTPTLPLDPGLVASPAPTPSVKPYCCAPENVYPLPPCDGPPCVEITGEYPPSAIDIDPEDNGTTVGWLRVQFHGEIGVLRCKPSDDKDTIATCVVERYDP